MPRMLAHLLLPHIVRMRHDVREEPWQCVYEVGLDVVQDRPGAARNVDVHGRANGAA
jgi:hypothetical protein